MPKQIQYLYRTKPVFDLCNQKNIVELYEMLSTKNFLENIQLSEIDGEVRLLSECTLDQIRIFKSALIKEVEKKNLNPFFRAYICNIFELHELKSVIEEKTNLSDSYPEEKQKVIEKLDRAIAELKILKSSNESGIQEIEKKCVELKAERNKYETLQIVVLVLTLLPIVPLGFISSITALLSIPIIAVALLEVKFFEPGNNFYTDKLEELYAERHSLKEPIYNLEMDIKSNKKTIVLFDQLRSDADKQVQKLKEQHVKLEKKIDNFNPDQLAPLNLKSVLSKKSMFKAEDSTVFFENAPETEESSDQPTIL
ncbi:MAG: hypothetical protein P4L79_12950 [Legionella sp.]|uniref:hypothetical protein n=1 Tax=Legionella sp. TaxID=459 RepID=UPI0028488AB5|nr:hypothetical protein [Legionella sp.]